MRQPRHHLDYLRHHMPRGQGGAVNQNDRNLQRAGCLQLGGSTCASGIFGNDMTDFVPDHQGFVSLHLKRPARQNDGAIRQRAGIRGIDQTQQIVVRFGCKTAEVLFADGEKHVRWGIGQSLNRRVDIGNIDPLIALARNPSRALQGDQGHIGQAAGLNRVSAHLRCERMRRVDDRADAFRPQVIVQSCDTAKATNPDRQGLAHRMIGAPGIREHRIRTRSGQGTGQQAGLGCAAQQKNACHG